MKKKIVETILDKMHISDELKETIEENYDLTKIVSKEIFNSILGQGDKVKDEIKEILAKELRNYLSKIDTAAAIRTALENMEVDIKVSFRKK
jgi:hypothetical protein